jgi:NAD(P)-dependent dehydrogenase (short-subunit alcohol dehydrogenase family)
MRLGVNPMRFRDQVVVVTGAARGIGFATAQLFVREGAHVVINDLDQADVDTAVLRLQSGHNRVVGIAADAGDEKCVRESVEHFVHEMGRIDILINNAGVMVRQPAHQLTAHTWRRAMSINLDGVFYWSHAVAIASMIPRRSGVIVNVSSLAGLVAIPNGAAYVASKHGVVGLTKALALDWGKFNIRVNALCPGMTWTDLSNADREKNPSMFVEREKRIPLGHAAQPEEQAEVIAFLASPQSSAVHGLIMNVDGGNLAMHSGTSLTS